MLTDSEQRPIHDSSSSAVGVLSHRLTSDPDSQALPFGLMLEDLNVQESKTVHIRFQ